MGLEVVLEEGFRENERRDGDKANRCNWINSGRRKESAEKRDRVFSAVAKS